MRTLHPPGAIEERAGAGGFLGPTKGATLRERAKAYIGRHIRDVDLSMDKVAAALDCSKRYLHLVFNAGEETVSGYVWRQRLDGCQAELSNPDSRLTLTEIAYAWGFNSSAHFSRAFKERYGVTPSEHRRRGRSRAFGQGAEAAPKARTLSPLRQHANAARPH